MIKLSLFMLDPVKAHKLYRKEIAELNVKLEAAKEVAKIASAERKALYKTMQDKVRQMGKQIGSMEKLK